MSSFLIPHQTRASPYHRLVLHELLKCTENKYSLALAAGPHAEPEVTRYLAHLRASS